MKILSASQIRQADAYTIDHEPVASIDLMERASNAFVKWFADRFGKDSTVAVFCGQGNNGGDGLAIARLLIEQHYQVEVFSIRKGQPSPDFATNEERLLSLTCIRDITEVADLTDLKKYDVIIDGIFGSGLSRPPEGLFAEVIALLNHQESTRIAIDIASGLFADKTSHGDQIFRPAHTVSFQLPKLAFLMPENYPFVGEWHVVDIALSQDFIDEQGTPHHYITSEDIRSIFKGRKKFAHKGNFGHALLVAGSYGKMGAAVLAGKAALRSGVGLLTVHVPGIGNDVLQTILPEAMVSIDPNREWFSQTSNIEGFNAVGVGPGLGKHKQTVKGLSQLMDLSINPMVIDADGLNILAENRELLMQVPPNSILTPHPKEFSRLAGEFSNDFARLQALKAFTSNYQVFVVLKGAHTAIAAPEGQIYFNSTGNPGMATAGSGDVLTGIITAFLAQNYSPLHAAMLGVYFHGLAGDMTRDSLGPQGLMASDFADHLPLAIAKFR